MTCRCYSANHNQQYESDLPPGLEHGVTWQWVGVVPHAVAVAVSPLIGVGGEGVAHIGHAVAVAVRPQHHQPVGAVSDVGVAAGDRHAVAEPEVS